MQQNYSLLSWDGRVVKAFGSKSNGIFPRRFESCFQRHLKKQKQKLFFIKNCFTKKNNSQTDFSKKTTPSEFPRICGNSWSCKKFCKKIFYPISKRIYITAGKNVNFIVHSKWISSKQMWRKFMEWQKIIYN